VSSLPRFLCSTVTVRERLIRPAAFCTFSGCVYWQMWDRFGYQSRGTVNSMTTGQKKKVKRTIQLIFYILRDVCPWKSVAECLLCWPSVDVLKTANCCYTRTHSVCTTVINHASEVGTQPVMILDSALSKVGMYSYVCSVFYFYRAMNTQRICTAR